MRTVLLVLALAVLPWIVNKLGAPAWATAAAAAPLLLYLIGKNWHLDDPEENMLGAASEPVRKWALLILGIGGVALGIAAASMKGTTSLLAIVEWLLPFAVLFFLFALFRIFKK